MLKVSITNLRKDLYRIIRQIIKMNIAVLVNTKKGNVVIISEEKYNSLVETLYLASIPNMKKSLIEAKHASANDYIDANTVKW